MSNGYGLTIFNVGKSADYDMITVATDIVGSRKIVGSPEGDRTKMQKWHCRSSQANRRSNVI